MQFKYLKKYCCLHTIANTKLQFFRVNNNLYQIPGGDLQKKKWTYWNYMVWDCMVGEFKWLSQDTKVVPVHIVIIDDEPTDDRE